MEKKDILQRDLNLEATFKSGRSYNLKETCVYDNYLYISTSDNNLDHPLMGKFWSQVKSTDLYCLLSSTTELSSSLILSSGGCGVDILPPPPEEEPGAGGSQSY